VFNVSKVPYRNRARSERHTKSVTYSPFVRYRFRLGRISSEQLTLRALVATFSSRTA
jgi:hypothetical protein